MAIIYDGAIPPEDGYYLIRVNGQLDVAQRCGTEWVPMGADYDCWQYCRDVYHIDVVCKLDLELIARAAEAQE